MENVKSILSRKINLPEIKEVALWAKEGIENKAILLQLARSDERLTSVNALWVMTHIDQPESQWPCSFRDILTDTLLSESDTAKKRMLLQLLRGMEYEPDTIRTDLLDYCLTKINSECETYSIRAFSIYIALKMCLHYPELAAELLERLSMMSHQALSPGLICARNKAIAEISKLNEKDNGH